MTAILLTAPLQGWASALDDVPDAVFAGRMLGDGVAIDPEPFMAALGLPLQ